MGFWCCAPLQILPDQLARVDVGKALEAIEHATLSTPGRKKAAAHRYATRVTLMAMARHCSHFYP
jgi:hypothetical protein